MEPKDAADTIREAAERRAEERFRTRAAIVIAVLAMLLAISSLGGANASKEMTNANILASDSWAFYQAKNIRQTELRIAVDETRVSLAQGGLTAEARSLLEKRLADYEATIKRYESEPDPEDSANPLKGEGKKELQARAREYEHRRDHAAAQDPNFDWSAALLQIAIVLGSVSIVASSRQLLALAVALGGVATVLLLNGFFLFAPLFALR